MRAAKGPETGDAETMLRVCRRWGGEVWGAGRLRAFSASKGCGCGLFSEPRPAPSAEEIARESERMIDKYRRKGWSAEKIRRAVEASEEKRGVVEEERGGLEPGTAALVADIAEDVGEAAVLAFWCTPGERRPVRSGRAATSVQIRSGERVVEVDEVVRVVAERSPLAKRVGAGAVGVG